ncbi:hypothetical protein VSDG_00235 [Cytospora chrysosperma]|uniref:Uncharacterized protein n=1 Tax=Cytospora chrysosperma TaxID=252740 RepID=A0A423WNZ1_CYTCH|nr:hypothetical protein VSDG_00235 [Valsa sordida]
MIYTSDYLRGAYNDLIWNAACSFAGVDILTFDAHHKPGRLYPLDHKYAGHELSTKKLTGGCKKDASKPRYLCYHVDQKTGEQCKRHYGRPDSVKEHFLSRHKGAIWDLSRVKRRRLMTESEMELDEQVAISNDPRAATKLAGMRERAAAQRAKTAGVFEAVCMVCNGVLGTNNIKKHVERELERTFGPGKVPYHQSMWYKRPLSGQ